MADVEITAIVFDPFAVVKISSRPGNSLLPLILQPITATETDFPRSENAEFSRWFSQDPLWTS
jgi:hypothetical protein